MAEEAVAMGPIAVPDSSPDAWLAEAADVMGPIAVPDSSPDRTPSPAKKKKASHPNPGVTTWNRKEGGRSVHSPLRMTAQEPLNEGQVERASQIVADLQQ